MIKGDINIRVVHINVAVDSRDFSVALILPKAVTAGIVTLGVVLSNPMIPRTALKYRVGQYIVKPI